MNDGYETLKPEGPNNTHYGENKEFSPSLNAKKLKITMSF